MLKSEEKQRRKEVFKQACLEGVTTILLQEETWLTDCLLSAVCRKCDLPIKSEDFAIWTTYWGSRWAACHKQCREEGMRSEAYECQCLDAACNDCKNFSRVEQGTGTCLKFNKTVSTTSNWFEGRDCFEHRRNNDTN